MESKRIQTGFNLLLLLSGCAAVAGWVCMLAQSRGWNLYLQEADFRPYFTGGYLLARKPSQLYSLDAQWIVQRELWPGLQAKPQLLPFIAPPFAALPFAPLSFLPLQTAFIVWTIFNVALLTALFYVVSVELQTLPLRWKIGGYLLLLTSVPAMATFMLGQWAFWLAFTALLAWRSLRRFDSHQMRGGVFLACLLLKPQLIVLPVLLLLVLRRWRALAGFGCGAIVLFVVSWLCIGTAGMQQYVVLLREASGWVNMYGVKPQSMLTARGFLHFLFQTDNVAQVILLWRVLALLILGVWAASVLSTRKAANQQDRAQFDLLWAISLVAAILLSPYLYVHDLMLVVVACICLWSAAFRAGAGRWLQYVPIFGYVWGWIGLLGFSRWTSLVPNAVEFMFVVLIVTAVALYLTSHAKPAEHQTARTHSAS